MARLIMLILVSFSPIFAAEPQPTNAWSGVQTPVAGQTQTIGGYSNGCFIGGNTLPHTGTGYETIRRSRNRYYGHPQLIEVVQWVAKKHHEAGGETLLIGDLSQPAGGPMPFGHRSHQAGLDADIWFTNVPEDKRGADASFQRLVNLKKERINKSVWAPKYVRLLKIAASHPKVERIFVNWILKRHLCKTLKDDKTWLRKLRPWWGHDRHFHIRLACPLDSPKCRPQTPVAQNAVCGGEYWFSDASVIARRKARKGKPKVRKAKVLPKACQALVK